MALPKTVILDGIVMDSDEPEWALPYPFMGLRCTAMALSCTVVMDYHHTARHCHGLP